MKTLTNLAITIIMLITVLYLGTPDSVRVAKINVQGRVLVLTMSEDGGKLLRANK